MIARATAEVVRRANRRSDVTPKPRTRTAATTAAVAEMRPDNDRSRTTIALVFQSHWSDPKLYVLQRSYRNKNTI